MGKSKTMVEKRISKRKSEGFFPCFFLKIKKKSLALLIFSISIILVNINILKVSATTGTDFNLTFYRDLKEIEFGSIDAEKIDWSISMSTGLVDSIAFDVYDVNGTKIHSGTSGSIRVDPNYFPIKFVARTNSNTDWRVTIGIKKYSGDNGDNGDSGELEGISNKLSGILDLLDSILQKIKDIDDFLSNPEHLQKGLNDLKASSEKLENYTPVSTNVVSSIGSLGSVTSDSSSLEFPVEILPGYTFNLLDLSHLGGVITSIRTLMIAILWIELAMFFIKVFVPKFKV